MVEATIHRAVFLLLLLVIMVVTANDLIRYHEQIFNAFKDLLGIA